MNSSVSSRALCLALFAAVASLPLLLLVGEADASKTRHCGDTRASYRENGTTQYVHLTNVRAKGTSCRRAGSVARSWGKDSRLSGDPSDGVRGYDCTYRRAGSDIGSVLCTKGNASIRFGAYDTSPYH